MMKKIVSILAVLLLCAALTVPAFATQEATPSVKNDLAPEVVPVEDPEGNPAAGVIIDADVVIDYVYYAPCLVVTPVYEAEESKLIPDHSEDLLLEVYEKLSSGEMTIPYEKFNAGLDASKMVVRDLFDVSFLCEEHPDMLEPVGVQFQITFKLGVDADEDVYVMTYKNGEWNPVVSTVNNGDGTVTCVFEDFCPVAFCVEVDDETPGDDGTGDDGTGDDGTGDSPVTPPVQTGDQTSEQLLLWGSVAVVCLIALAVLTVVYTRSLKKKN